MRVPSPGKKKIKNFQMLAPPHVIEIAGRSARDCIQCYDGGVGLMSWPSDRSTELPPCFLSVMGITPNDHPHHELRTEYLHGRLCELKGCGPDFPTRLLSQAASMYSLAIAMCELAPTCRVHYDFRNKTELHCK